MGYCFRLLITDAIGIRNVSYFTPAVISKQNRIQHFVPKAAEIRFISSPLWQKKCL